MGRGKSAHSLELVRVAKEILQEIQPATVRAVCYRLFTMKLIVSMQKNETNKVGTQLVYAREQGIIPWAWIVDETREAEYGGGWDNPEQFINAAKTSYRRNRWATQPCRVEVWSEKGTVRGSLAPVLQEYGVTFRVMHGYASATALYQVAAEKRGTRRPLVVFYVGDWDPSGLHMSEVDIPKRLYELISGGVLGGGINWDYADFLDNGAGIKLRRLALAEEDTQDGLPSFSAETKLSDTRCEWFKEEYGGTCWELDALSPNVLRTRVQQAILEQIDQEAWERAGLGETAEQKTLATVLGKWQESISMQARK